MRRAAKVDTNQNPIVKDLRTIFGECILDLSRVGGGCPDLLVAVRGVNLLMEIKADAGKLTPAQIRFHRNWPGQVAVARTLADALAIIERETCR